MIASDLPRPRRTRWQPIRLGLVDLFLYDHAEFRFRDGHLLLRGNNGTGKSKVLALTLPFLLDGELSASRVEPDGDPTKRMDWNLLMGDRHAERTGYTWLEFGRRDDTGADVFLTLGCGLKAVSGRGIVEHWFFVANGRLGIDFGLVGPTGIAHSRERLADSFASVGHVYRRAEDYRRAIDERLFRLGQERYEALIKLLIQLRQPQLTKRPDEERLSRALSEALRPVDQAILNVVAEAFHDLEQQRMELGALRETHSAVDRFLAGYRRYAATAARRLAHDVRSSHSAFQGSQRELAEVRQELERAEADDRAAIVERDQVSGNLAGARGRTIELRDSREVRELDAADRLVRMAEQQAQQAADLQAEAVQEVARQHAALEALRASAADAERQLQPLITEVNRTALVAGLRPAPGDVIAGLSPTADPPAEEMAIERAEQVAASSARTRAEATRHLRGLIERADLAMARLEDARQRVHERLAERDAARELLESALRDVDAAAASFVDSWAQYLRSLVEVRPVAADEILLEVAGWAGTLDGPDPGNMSVSRVADTVRNALSERRASGLASVDETSHALGLLTDERERLLRGELLAPPQPYTRDAVARQVRAGAPLWQLVDFQADVPDWQRAGLEAALESAAILDAWVTPDGDLLAPDTHDVIVLGGSPVDPSARLTAMLQPGIDHADPRAAAVDEATIRRILDGIGLGVNSADTWVDSSGRWRVGVLEGCWSKPAPTFIGGGARDAARRQRLALLAIEIERIQEELNVRRLAVHHIEARQRTLSDELSRMPSADALRERHGTAGDARRQLARADARLTEQEAVAANREGQAEAARAARDEAAGDLHLPADRTELDAISQTIAEYAAATAGLWPRAQHQVQALGRLRTSQGQLEHVQSVLAERGALAESASRSAREERGRRDGLRDSIGATVEQVRSELEATAAQIRVLEHEIARLENIRRTCASRIGGAQASQLRLERSLVEQDGRRTSAISLLQRFAANGLLIAAVPGLEIPTGWSPDPVARLARRVEQALEATEADDQTWERLRRDIATRFKDLQDGMSPHGHSAILDPGDGWHVVTIAFHGQQRSPDELVALLSDEIEHRERLLNARERELIEEHLVNEIASHLQDLIQDAEVQVHDMNEELRQRPTSTGMRLRFRWTPRPDGPAGLAEARTRLMRQVHDAWSGDDRSAVSAFLKAQIDMVRTANESGTWLEHLTEAFDYRRWHRFTIERMQDGHWRSATGPASSGERVLTVTLPLFAAASAHYRSAQLTAPRLVLMDEVFAGVDDDSRSKSIGLLATFDLDFVMTSEREWGCYSTLHSLAIYQLARREGIDAVHISAWTWDGRAPSRVEPVQPSSMIPIGSSSNGLSINGHAHTQNGA